MNKVRLYASEVKNTSGVSYGYILWDEYALCRDSSCENPIEGDLELLLHVFTSATEKEQEILNSVVENEKGIEINGTWYDFEEIKDILVEE